MKKTTMTVAKGRHIISFVLAVMICSGICNAAFAGITNFKAVPSTTSVSLTWTKDTAYPYTEVTLNGQSVCGTSNAYCTASNLQMGTDYTFSASCYKMVSSQKVYGSGTASVQTRTEVGGTLTSNLSLTSGEYIMSSLTINAGVTLTISPGVTVKVKSGCPISVKGTLTATGVTFTWADGTNQWDGIWFSGSDSGNSRLENCVIEHASGRFVISGLSDSACGAIYIAQSAATVTGCEISNCNASTGIYIVSASPEITGNTVTGMNDYGIYITGNSSPAVTGNIISNNTTGAKVDYSSSYTMNPIFSGNTYSENTEDLYVYGTVKTAVNWSDKCYTVGSLTIETGASLAIASGVTVKVKSGCPISVKGTLTATGVTFTWADGTNQWDGIWFSGSDSGNSRLENCVIEHASGRFVISGLSDTPAVRFILPSPPPLLPAVRSVTVMLPLEFTLFQHPRKSPATP